MLVPGNGGHAVGRSGHRVAADEVSTAPRLFNRGIAGVRAMVDVGVERGVPVPACLDGSGVDENALADDAAHVRAWQELTVAQNLVRATDDAPGLGLAVGSRIPLRTYSVLGFALLASPTLREAAAVGLRYLELTFAMVGIHLQEDGNEVRLVLDDGLVPPPVRHFFIEREIANIRAILDTIVGRPFTPSGWICAFHGLKRPRRTRRLTTCPSPSGRRATRSSPSRRYWSSRCRRRTSTPCRCANASAGSCWPGAPTPDSQRGYGNCSCSGRTASLTWALPQPRCTSPPALCAGCLAVEGTSYRRLVDAARHTRAVEMLSTLGLGVDQIAVRLGYADAAAFIRAFRRWTGATPGAYRTRSVRNLSRAHE